MRSPMLCKPEKHVPPTRQYMVEIGQLIEEMVNNGTLLAIEGLMPSAKGAPVGSSGEGEGEIPQVADATR
jgi:hypothetical protein